MNLQKTSLETRSFKTVIKGLNMIHSGETALLLKKTLEKMSVAPSVIKRIAVAAYEAEMNIAIHAQEGTLTAAIKPGYVEIMAEDKGPGIPNMDLAMREGYSTASQDLQRQGFGAGMGLPNIKKNADFFEMHSYVNKGTKLRVKIFFE